MTKRISSSDEPDVYVLSYPKVGRTWLRALIGKYLSLKYTLPEELILSTELITSESGLPSVTFTHDGAAMSKGASYSELSHDKRKYANKKVILIGRDIKDTLVSAYFQATKRIYVFDGSISEFIASEQYGFLKIMTFYDIWRRNRYVPHSFLFFRYEDLHQDPRATLGKVLSFIGEVNVDEYLVEQSVEYSSFNNLKKLEMQDTFNKSILRAKNLEDPESYKVRKGKVGGYTEYLSEEDQVFIDEAIEAFNFDFLQFL